MVKGSSHLPHATPYVYNRRWAYTVISLCFMYVLAAQLVQMPTMKIKTDRLPSTTHFKSLWQYDPSNQESDDEALITSSKESYSDGARQERALREKQRESTGGHETERLLSSKTLQEATSQSRGQRVPTDSLHDNGSSSLSDTASQQHNLPPPTQAAVARRWRDINGDRKDEREPTSQNDADRKSFNLVSTTGRRGELKGDRRQGTARDDKKTEDDEESDDYLVNLLLPYKDDGSEEEDLPTEPVAEQLKRAAGTDMKREDEKAPEEEPLKETPRRSYGNMERVSQPRRQSRDKTRQFGTGQSWNDSHVVMQQTRREVDHELMPIKSTSQWPLRRSVQRDYNNIPFARYKSRANAQDGPGFYHDERSAQNPGLVPLDKSAHGLRPKERVYARVQTGSKRFIQKRTRLRVIQKPSWRAVPTPPPPENWQWPLLNVFDAPLEKPPGCFRILLIIIFNDAHYGNIPFLLRYFHHGFKHIVFYGPVAKRLPPVPRLHPKEIVVHATIEGTHGYYQQWTLAQVMKDYPMYDGYLWMGDDVYLNYPQLLMTMDPTKFWLNPDIEVNGIFHGFKFDWSDPHVWGNWVKNFGIRAIRRGFSEIPQRFIRKMASAFGQPHSVIKSYSDIGYIPRAFAKDIVSLFYNLRYAIFEIAIPTACYLVSTPNDRQNFSKAVYLWYDGKRRHPGDFIDADTTFLHPVKYSLLQNRKMVSRWLRYQKKQFNFGKSPPNRFKC